MVRTQVQLTEEQANLLKKIASERHISIAELIRRSVDIFIHSRPYIDMEERRRRALAAAGCFHSGVSDLSTNHDKYLAEALGK